MSDPIDRAAEVLSRVEKTTGPSWLDRERAQALDAAGLLRHPDDPEVEVNKKFGQPSTCVVRSRGVVVFAGVSKDALLRDRADRIERGETDADA